MSLVELFSALGDPTRSRVVEMLHERARPVHELAAAFDISRPAISRHLKVLKDAGLVREEKAGRENVYSLQRGKLKPMLDWLGRHRVKDVVGRAAAAGTAKSGLQRPGGRGRGKRPGVARHPGMTSASTVAPQLSFFDF